MACGPGHPELSKSYMDMAIKLFTFTFTFTNPMQPASHRDCHTRTDPEHTHRTARFDVNANQ